MQTAQEIKAYLELELAKAYGMHEQAQDKQEKLLHLVKAHTIEQLLEEIILG